MDLLKVLVLATILPLVALFVSNINTSNVEYTQKQTTLLLDMYSIKLEEQAKPTDHTILRMLYYFAGVPKYGLDNLVGLEMINRIYSTSTQRYTLYYIIEGLPVYISEMSTFRDSSVNAIVGEAIDGINIFSSTGLSYLPPMAVLESDKDYYQHRYLTNVVGSLTTIHGAGQQIVNISLFCLNNRCGGYGLVPYLGIDIFVGDAYKGSDAFNLSRFAWPVRYIYSTTATVNNDPTEVVGSNVVVRPLLIPTTGFPNLGIFNMFVFKTSTNQTSRTDNVISSTANAAFYNYLGLNYTWSQYNIPILFSTSLYSKQPHGQYIVSLNQMDYFPYGTISLLRYVTDISTWKSSIVTAPYLIPLFSITLQNNINVAMQTLSTRSTYIPVLIFSDRKIIVLDTALVGYDIYNISVPNVQSPFYLHWVSGETIGCGKIEFSNPTIRPLSPYTKVFYIDTAIETALTGIPQNITMLVYDPYNDVGYYLELRNVSLITYDAYDTKVCRGKVNIGSVHVRTFNTGISDFNERLNTYIDLQYIKYGRVLFYIVRSTNIEIISINIHTGSVENRQTFTIPFEYNLVMRSSPNIHGMVYPIPSIIEENVTHYVRKYIRGLLYDVNYNISTISLPKNHTVQYTVTVVPINITYVSQTLEEFQNTLARITINDTRVLAAIATPDARDLRVFSSPVPPETYFMNLTNRLIFGIEDYRPGRNLTLLVLLPYIKTNETRTIYIYMGYPYATSLAASPTWLKNNYPILP